MMEKPTDAAARVIDEETALPELIEALESLRQMALNSDQWTHSDDIFGSMVGICTTALNHVKPKGGDSH